MFSLRSGVLALLGTAITVVGAGNVQSPLGAFKSASYDDGLFAPFEDLHALSRTEFTTLGHPLFPNYGVRIKESDFCDGTVKYGPFLLFIRAWSNTSYANKDMNTGRTQAIST